MILGALTQVQWTTPISLVRIQIQGNIDSEKLSGALRAAKFVG